MNGANIKMKVIHVPQRIEPSIFLAGPTPRDLQTKSWRPRALEILSQLNYDGTVYIPETEDWGWGDHGYYNQINWENDALAAARVIVFWVPREISRMPGLTTNVEFGRYVTTGKCLLGYPNDAVKIRYLDSLAKRFNCPVFDNLATTLKAAVKMSQIEYDKKDKL